jgi:hypothetical protein
MKALVGGETQRRQKTVTTERITRTRPQHPTVLRIFDIVCRKPIFLTSLPEVSSGEPLVEEVLIGRDGPVRTHVL